MFYIVSSVLKEIDTNVQENSEILSKKPNDHDEYQYLKLIDHIIGKGNAFCFYESTCLQLN